MARIFENNGGRRNVMLSTDDVITLVREYQRLTVGLNSYSEIRRVLDLNLLYLPED